MRQRGGWRFRLGVLAAVGGLLGGGAEAGAGEGVDFPAVVRAAKDKVFPAVLFVRCVREASERGRREGTEVSGSGVLISAQGEFLTNWHVVDRAREVRCQLHDGRAFTAEILGADKDTDVALGRLRLPPSTPALPFGTLGDSDALVEGDFVMAMGAPWGMSRSVSIGIVACARRYLDDHSEYSLWIQTDASISPGNSGGPLVDTRGAVVGLNARGTSWGGDLGFAIPASTLREIVEQVRARGKVVWSWSGLRLQPLRDFDSNTWFEGDEGVIVAGTDAGSPAEQAGFLAEDRLLSVGAVPLNARTHADLPAVHRTLGRLPLGEKALVRLRRGGREIQVALVPREKGAVVGDECVCPRWDFSVKAINQFERPDLHFHRQQGVFVHGLSTPGNAANAGLRAGDILLKVGAAEVRTLEDVRKVHAATLAKLSAEPRMVLSILRNGLFRQVVLDIGRDYERE